MSVLLGLIVASFLDNQVSFEGECELFSCLKYLAIGSPLGLDPVVGEELTVHNTDISLLLSICVWPVLLSPPIERRETLDQRFDVFD